MNFLVVSMIFNLISERGDGQKMLEHKPLDIEMRAIFLGEGAGMCFLERGCGTFEKCTF